MMTIHERVPFLGFALVALLLPVIGVEAGLAISFLLLIWQGLGGGFTANSWTSMISKIIPSETRGTFFGLQAGVFTNRLKDVFHAFNHIDAGGIVINDVPTFRADQQPYGGMKNSGLGREGIRFTIEDMTEIKVLSMNLK